MNVKVKYLKDETGDTISPVVSMKSVFDSSGNNLEDTKFILDKVYPICSIYININEVNPGTLFGGTWELLKDRFLLGAGNLYSSGSIGGSDKLVALIVNYDGKVALYRGNSNNKWWSTNAAIDGGYDKEYITAQSGATKVVNDETNENGTAMPPYLAVYIWKRTAY